MYFSTIEIKPVGGGKVEWEVVFSYLEGDREPPDNGPNPLGFYHYPSSTSKEDAFDVLKSYLIKQHQDRIADIERSLDALRQVQMPVEEEDTGRYKCAECGEIFPVRKLLRALNPFNLRDTLLGCPSCKSVDAFALVCDEPGCNQISTCGWMDSGKYRRTCGDHMK